MQSILELVGWLEDKLKNLIERYEFLKEENDILLAKIDSLQGLVSKYEEDLKTEKEKYKLLKVAKTIEGSIEDSKETRKKIDALVREIDKCIVVLGQ